MKILLIDDEPLMLTLLGQQLKNMGFTRVVACTRAHDALAVLENELVKVGLVFCDLQMPEMDGVELVRNLARIGYTGGLILVSAEDARILKTAKQLARAHQLDVLGALHKPVTPEHLERILGQQPLRGKPARRSARKRYAAEDLQRALAGGELVNYYQPKVVIATGEVVGVETLVRWQHPDDGLVSPDQFVALAEECGLIDALTRSVLRDAMQQLRRWRDANIMLRVAVNLSMDNLSALDFPDWLAQAARQAGVPLESLVLEVTESRLMKNPLAVLDILTRLRLKRIGLSIDDFGTGYSSLAQLRDIPFDELKIDQSFVHGACRDASLRAIFDASLGMAHELAMGSVAEGVEDAADWAFLRASRCHLAQGYFIARPMPASEMVGWMADWASRLPQGEPCLS